MKLCIPRFSLFSVMPRLHLPRSSYYYNICTFLVYDFTSRRLLPHYRPQRFVEIKIVSKSKYDFVAVFLGCTSTGRLGLCFLWFYVQELPKAQPAVVLVLKRLRRRGNGLKSHPTDFFVAFPGWKPVPPGGFMICVFII